MSSFQLAHRPKDAQQPSTATPSRSSHNAPRNTEDSNPGFILIPKDPDQRLRRFLDDPPFQYCLVDGDRTVTSQNAVILLFRTLNFYSVFKDMCVYMYAVARDIHEEIDIIRDTVRRFVKGREEFLKTKPSSQPAIPLQASDKEQLICKLVDEYIDNEPSTLEVTPCRYDFFEEVRRRWTTLIDGPGAIDPHWVFPPVRIPHDADWLVPARVRSSSIVVHHREVDREREAERRGDDATRERRAKGPNRQDRDRGRSRRSLSLERQARYGMRRDRSVTPERGGDRRRSPVGHRSPVRYDSEGRRLLDSYRPSYLSRSPMRPISPSRESPRNERRVSRYDTRTSLVRYRATSSRLELESARPTGRSGENNAETRRKKSALLDDDEKMDLGEGETGEGEVRGGKTHEVEADVYRGGCARAVLLMADQLKGMVDEWPELAAGLTSLSDGCTGMAEQMDSILDREQY